MGGMFAWIVKSDDKKPAAEASSRLSNLHNVPISNEDRYNLIEVVASSADWSHWTLLDVPHLKEDERLVLIRGASRVPLCAALTLVGLHFTTSDERKILIDGITGDRKSVNLVLEEDKEQPNLSLEEKRFLEASFREEK